MNKFLKGMKRRYFEGIEWMKLDEGLASMMYWAATIIEIFILCKLTPEHAMQCTKILGVNLILVYLYSLVTSIFISSNIVTLIQGLGFIGIELLVGFTIGKGLNFWLLFALFAIPIIVAIAMIYVQENYFGFEDFIKCHRISNFGIVVLTTLIPVITITIPLFSLEWNIFTKVAIIIAFMLIAPFICWADSKDYGIFGAIGIEW